MAMMIDLTGRQFGDYRLVRLLGTGGFASVYLGQHVHIGSMQAAIKILHLTNVDHALFQKEAETMASLIHPHIVRLLGFSIQPKTNIPFLVMDYAPAGSLLHRHPKGTQVPLPTVVQYVKDIASALQYAHDERIIHRDVKPENILVGRFGEVLLSDFGIAMLSKTGRTSLDVGNHKAGTPYYMAPEMIRGRPEKASDQYALGIVVYELLCGTPPFTEGDIYQLGMQHLTEPIPPLREMLPSLSPRVEEVILKALAKKPEDRFPSVQAFAEALEEASKVPPALPIGPLAKKLADHFPPFQASAETLEEASKAPPIGTSLLTYRGHFGFVRTLGWSPDGSRIASGSNDKTVQIWEVGSGRLLRSYSGHSSEVRTLGWSPDGSRIASGSRDNTVQVWEVSSGQLLCTYSDHSRGVKTLAWSPDGSRIASGSFEVQVWEVNSGWHLRSYNGHSGSVYTLAWSPDGSRIASGSYDQTVQVWEVSSGRLLTYRGHSNEVRSLAWSPDGSRIASGSYDQTVQVWEVSSGRLLLTYSGHSSWVYTLAWSPDGSRIASGSRDKTVQTFAEALEKASKASPIRALAKKPAERFPSVRAFTETLEVASKASPTPPVGTQLLIYSGHSNVVWTLAWSPDGSRIASGSGDKTVQVWEVSSGRLLHTFSGHTSEVRTLTWSPDGSRIASGSNDKTVQVWEVSSERLLHTYRGHSLWVSTLAWSPDGLHIASGSDDTTVHVWHVSSGRLLYTHRGHSNSVSTLAWSNNGSRIASGSYDKTVQVWQAE